MSTDNPAALDPDFHPDAVVCDCHDARVKTIAPCYFCKSQVKDEQCYQCFKDKMSTDRELKPKLNHVARIVNNHFLQSPYEGKDWESVRNDLIEELTSLLTEATHEARIDELERLQALHTRTYRQTVTDNKGDVYVDETHEYISKYETQERISALQAAQRTKNKEEGASK